MKQYTNTQYPLNFCKFEEIEEYSPRHINSTNLLDGAYINLWYIEEKDAYYATVECL